MAINLKFDLMGNPEPPSIVLANRNGNKLGQLKVDVNSIDVKDKFGDIDEFSFTLNKYIDDELTPHWDKVVDFKLVNCPEWDLWFEIKVELDEATETVKTVYCTQLGQAELSQIMIYNTEINTEADIEREDFKTSILYDKNNPKSSILHRLLEKAPHYSIAHVDESIQRIQRQFSFDGVSICDAFNEIAEEIGCLFVYNSNSQVGGKPNRTISVYDLLQNCNNKDCKHRGEFTDKCPKCGGTDIDYGYGEDTTIFVTADELATEGIQLVTDTDSVKNCFKLEAGDDLMTATIRNCNPNGSDYIWYFSDAVKEDMSKELVEAIESYDVKYKECYNEHPSNLDANLVGKYNALVNKYEPYYNTKSTCINCKHEDYFKGECPSCHSNNILTGKTLQTIDTPITGYPALMNAYYNTIDLALYLESGLMPSIEMSETSAKEQLDLLTKSALSPVAVNVENIANVSLATANSAVLSMAKIIVKPTYKVEIKEGSASLSNSKVWSGQFIVTNYSDETDTAINDNGKYIDVTINNDTKTFIQQKIDKALKRENTDDYSISGLFDADKYDYNAFCAELKKYALNPLKSFYDACDACLSILTEQGAGNEDQKDLYDNLYTPYYKKSQAIAKEMKIREDEIAIIKGVYEEADEGNKKIITKGLQQSIGDCQNAIHKELNFEEYLREASKPIGRDLWLEFCAYRREDKYSNSNYVSDGLNNAELFERALEFVEVAENEIFKSAELQHSISANLNNLLALPKFKPLIKYFKTGNWIRVRIDDRIFKLRLLEYNFSYGDLENIPVEFSDVTKIKNGMTDVQDVFEQASSMASSYDSVQRQAQKGDVARSTINQWLTDGLSSANVQIQSNDSEEILLTKNGLLARSYDDITGTYSPEQLKITHNIMAYTDDNWETVSAALGKHNYKYYKDGNFVDAEGYGISAKFAQAAYIIGSQMIGGEIVSSNYQPKTQGTHINLLNGEFDFAGGKIVYDIDGDDPKKSTLTLKGVTIQWDGDDAVNPPAIENITNLSDEIDKINKANNALFSTTISEKSVISPLIVGGYLNIKNDTNNTGVVIDPNGLVNEDYIFRVYNGSTTAIGLDVDGNAEFSGTINGSHFVGGDLIIGDTNKVDNYAEIANNGTLTCTNVHIKGGVFKASNKADGTVHTWISDDGVLNTNGANISNNFTATNGTIGSCSITDCRITDGTITKASIGKCEITDGSLKIGTQDSGYYAWISSDGVLNAKGVNITGTVHASAGGSIGGWDIGDYSIKSTNDTTFLYSGSDANYQRASLVNGSSNSPVRFCSGYNAATIITITETEYVMGSGGTFTYTPSDCDKIETVVSCKVVSNNGSVTHSIINDGKSVKVVYSGSGLGATIETIYTYRSNKPINHSPFVVLEDGSLYANNANISGTIYATDGSFTGEVIVNKGNIGGLQIQENGISSGANGLTFLSSGTVVAQGLEVNDYFKAANLQIGKISGRADDAAYFNFESQSSSKYEIIPEATYNVTDYGNKGVMGTGYNAGSVTITVTTNYRLQSTKTFEIILHYWDSGVAGMIRKVNVTVLKGEDCGSISVDYMIKNNFGSIIPFSSIYSISPTKYIEDVPVTTQAIQTKGDLIPFSEDYSLGGSATPWGNIWVKNAYCLNGEIFTSDANKKNTVEAIGEKYVNLFDSLNPVTFKFNDGESGRVHIGLIAQELKNSMDVCGIDSKDLAAYCSWQDADGNETYGIRYGEFISLCIYEIQKLKKRVAELENK